MHIKQVGLCYYINIYMQLSKFLIFQMKLRLQCSVINFPISRCGNTDYDACRPGLSHCASAVWSSERKMSNPRCRIKIASTQPTESVCGSFISCRRAQLAAPKKKEN